VTLTPHPF